MMPIIQEKIREKETQEIKRAVVEWDAQAQEDYLRLLELAYQQPGRFAHAARIRAPNAFARVGPKKAA